jgi:GWxTD domain-containing protein
VVPVRWRVLLAAWGLLCLGPRVLSAQDAPHRPALNQLRSALDSATTLADVDRVAAGWAATSRKPVGGLGDAYIELRRGVLAGDRATLVSAWDEFDRVVRIHPDWPYARLGLAVAALEVYSRGYPLPATYDDVAGGTHYDGYSIQMKRALRSEPTFAPAINWLAGTLSSEGDRLQPGEILQALQFIADSTGSTDPRIQLILARAERMQGDAAQSIPRIDDYMREGGDAGVGALEMARSLAWTGSLEDAAVEYMSGAEVQTTEARATYRLDLSWVATPRELVRFDSLPADSVGKFIGTFWTSRDAQELRPAGSRLREHLRRWVYVSRNFRVPEPGRRTAYKEAFIPYNGTPCQRSGANTLDDYNYIEPARQGGYRTPERVFDHRAIVYMRHGEPIYRLGGEADTTGLLVEPDRNVTWVYLIGGQLRVFTFLGHQALGSNSASTLVVNAPPNLDVVLQLSALSSEYAQFAGVAQFQAAGGSMVPLQCQRAYLDVIDRQRDDAAVAVRTDTHLRRFARPLTAALQLSALGQPAEGTGEMVAVIAVRTTELASAPAPAEDSVVRFVLRVQAAAIDSLTGEAVRLDTLRQFVTTRDMVQRNAWLSFIAKLPIRPGMGEVRLSVEQEDDRGSVFATRIEPAGAGFSASDIVLGSERGSIPWRRNGETVQVSPFSTYAPGEAVPIYYELYGLASGVDYRTMLSLRRAGDRKLTSTLTFSDVASAPTLSANRALTLDNVKPGQYDLILTVEERSTGRRVTRQRPIVVAAH